jgi:predicted RNA methylase
MSQNTSHAVMSQRNPNMDTIDNFPTPPWATRAFIECILLGRHDLKNQTCLEPACGQGYMSLTLKEYFKSVDSSDILNYGYPDTDIADFLSHDFRESSYDWVITNPPFKKAEEFIHQALRVSSVGVAMLVRTVFIESVGRYERLFSKYPPSSFIQYVERVAMVKGRLDRTASTATGYGWVLWDKNCTDYGTKLEWIPPSRKMMERDSDYGELAQGELF